MPETAVVLEPKMQFQSVVLLPQALTKFLRDRPNALTFLVVEESSLSLPIVANNSIAESEQSRELFDFFGLPFHDLLERVNTKVV